ncbi:hypothetical protein ADEAN_000910100 [Angomonas deanei]|uniref:Uncharacterized protein n=1 Tax=Angomonas deanei TaxID=59799 RepID=A0A7G2CQE0_9TRYP|nr:hypothetical protein ADEAN_000910100 [Angomonas deanei]
MEHCHPTHMYAAPSCPQPSHPPQQTQPSAWANQAWQSSQQQAWANQVLQQSQRSAWANQAPQSSQQQAWANQAPQSSQQQAWANQAPRSSQQQAWANQAPQSSQQQAWANQAPQSSQQQAWANQAPRSSQQQAWANQAPQSSQQQAWANQAPQFSQQQAWANQAPQFSQQQAWANQAPQSSQQQAWANQAPQSSQQQAWANQAPQSSQQQAWANQAPQFSQQQAWANQAPQSSQQQAWANQAPQSSQQQAWANQAPQSSQQQAWANQAPQFSQQQAWANQAPQSSQQQAWANQAPQSSQQPAWPNQGPQQSQQPPPHIQKNPQQLQQEEDRLRVDALHYVSSVLGGFPGNFQQIMNTLFADAGQRYGGEPHQQAQWIWDQLGFHGSFRALDGETQMQLARDAVVTGCQYLTQKQQQQEEDRLRVDALRYVSRVLRDFHEDVQETMMNLFAQAGQRYGGDLHQQAQWIWDQLGFHGSFRALDGETQERLARDAVVTRCACRAQLLHLIREEKQNRATLLEGEAQSHTELVQACLHPGQELRRAQEEWLQTAALKHVWSKLDSFPEYTQKVLRRLADEASEKWPDEPDRHAPWVWRQLYFHGSFMAPDVETRTQLVLDAVKEGAQRHANHEKMLRDLDLEEEKSRATLLEKEGNCRVELEQVFLHIEKRLQLEKDRQEFEKRLEELGGPVGKVKLISVTRHKRSRLED